MNHLDISLDDIDSALVASAEKYLHGRHAFETKLKLQPALRRFDPAVWQELADMGWLGITTPEADGGLGLRISSAVLLAQACGQALLNEPLVSAGWLSTHLLAQAAPTPQRQALLQKALCGDLRVVIADGDPLHTQGGTLHGRLDLVPDADAADVLLVAVRTGGQARTLHAVNIGAKGLDRQPCRLLDGRGAAHIDFHHCTAQLLDGALPATVMRATQLLAALLTAADTVGAMKRSFSMTLEYLKTRQQFGRVIGTLQALQHRAVDLHILVQECRAVLARAVAACNDGLPEAAMHVHAAKAVVCGSARHLAQEAIQLHGGIGVTEEYALSHCLRRIRVNEQLHGSAHFHASAFARQLAARDSAQTYGVPA